ncbi:MAG: MerR family transcriptional regulator [Actinomycetota bacterium]|nr:MerR family transcriptional regulator [Actinomycetota bacterium]
MKISELSRRSDRSVAAIKYYLREGLLPAGRATAVNQADYAEQHLARLRLVTTLLDVGGLTINGVKHVLAAIDDERLPLHDALGVAHHALAQTKSAEAPSGDVLEAERDVGDFIAALGWRAKAEAPARTELARALASLRRLGWEVDANVFERYAEAADVLAAWELEQTPISASRGRTLEAVVVGTVVFEQALVALRRLAQEHHSATRFS